jgi:hypothetical protein
MSQTYLVQAGGYQAFGAFVEDELVSLVMTYRSRQQPCFYITRLYSTNPKYAECAKDLIECAATYMRVEYGLKRFYAAFPATWAKLYPRWLPDIVKKYTAYTEATVPKHTRPPYDEFFTILFARQLWPIDMIVRCYILRGES